MGLSGSKANPKVEQKVLALIQDNPIMIFSKSYCPFCDMTKNLLKNAGVKSFKVIELDNDSDGTAIQAFLQKHSGQKTVPNCYIGQEHLGGNDDMHSAAKNGTLKSKLDSLNIANKF